MLFNAGDHVPLIPLVDVVGRGVNTSPLQIDGTDANVGVSLLFTVIVNDAVFAHCPAVGVNVYVVVAVLFRAGDHVPEKPLVDVVGRGFNTSPLQIGATVENTGV